MTPKNPLNTPPPEEDYSLEDILAEYGGRDRKSVV